MKHLNFLLFLLIVGGTAIITTSCSEEGTTDLSPLLTVTPSGLDAGNEITEGSTFTVEIVAGENPSSGKNLETLVIDADGVDNDTTITINNPSYTGTFSYDAPAAGDNNTFTFTVTDRDGETNAKTLTVTGVSGVTTTPFTTSVSGAFFHVGGSLQGAYDLINDATVAASGADADKDMRNTDMAGATFTGSWDAPSTTMYVKDNAFDYTNATVEAAMASYSAGTASGTVTNPANGDIYVALLRGGTDYAVIQITDVDPTNNECSCANTGKISFDYKK